MGAQCVELKTKNVQLCKDVRQLKTDNTQLQTDNKPKQPTYGPRPYS
jgi:hypothetical protein